MVRAVRSKHRRNAGRRGWFTASARLILTNPISVGERYGVKKAQPAILSRQVWNAVQVRLRERARH